MSQLAADLSPSGPSHRPVARAVAFVALALAVWLGARHLALLCDDAFITFRYVGNAMDGRGLVWNPSPFAPVEGYTSFLWAIVLWAAWAWAGVEPPAAANALSIACGLATFAVVGVAARGLRDRTGRRLPDVVVFATLAAIASNRTFLQWMTSGLETSLYNLTFVGWAVLGWRWCAGRTTGGLAAWSACAAGAALTRPDGLVLVAATGACALATVLHGRLRWRQAAFGGAPLLLVAAHVAWRRAFYGEWLPNTYYAKVSTPWPESGVRYLALFVLENGVWIWVPFALLWLVVEARRGIGSAGRALFGSLPAIAVVGSTVFLCGYYVWVVGGDHFEFRVFSHLVPLGGLATAAMAARVRAGALLPVAMVAAIGAAASVAWGIAAVQPTTTFLYEPIGPHVPAWLRPLARWYDGHRAWLSLQAVGVRCDQHRAFLVSETARLPARVRTEFSTTDVPVHAAECVGMVGWVLPDVAVLDVLGLNDHVAARWPVPAPDVEPTAVEKVLSVADRDRDGLVTEAEVAAAAQSAADAALIGLAAHQVFLVFGDAAGALRVSDLPAVRAFFAGRRQMAHERHAPGDYVQAFAPNATIEDQRIVVRGRAVPLDAERIRAIEGEWRERARRGGH